MEPKAQVGRAEQAQANDNDTRRRVGSVGVNQRHHRIKGFANAQPQVCMLAKPTANIASHLASLGFRLLHDFTDLNPRKKGKTKTESDWTPFRFVFRGQNDNFFNEASAHADIKHTLRSYEALTFVPHEAKRRLIFSVWRSHAS